MNNKIFTLLIAVSFMAFQSCSEDEPSEPVVVKTKTEIISASPWILRSLTINPGIDEEGDGVLVTDLYATGDACDNDDETVYNANGTGSYNEGATKCDPSSPQELGTFSWSFNANETVLTEDGETYALSELTEGRMVQLIEYEEDGVDYTVTATYTH